MQPERKLKVAVFVGDIQGFGGAERWILNVAQLTKDYIDFTLVMSNVGGKKRKTLDELKKEYPHFPEVVYLDSINIAGVAMFPTGSSRKRVSEIAAASDAIYITTISPQVLYYSILEATKGNRAKSIFAFHNSYLSKNLYAGRNPLYVAFMKGKVKKVLDSVGNFHVINKEDHDTLSRDYPSCRIFDVKIFLREEDATVSIDKDRFNVLYISRLVRQKGIDLLLDVIARVNTALQGQNQLEFHIIGSGDPENEARIKEMQAGSQDVKWLGFVDDATLAKEYLNGSLFLMTSRWEGLPQVLLDAQSYGIPSITFDVRGCQDVISRYDVNGKLIKPFDTEAFAAQVLEYYGRWKSDKSAYLKMKKEISKNTLADYGKARIIPQMVDMFYSTGGKASPLKKSV